MRRKIKFPLIMKDGIEVRNIDELRENFDLEKIINYYIDGKLQKWLKDRNYNEEVDKIVNLNVESKEFSKDLQSIFGIDYKNDIHIDISNLLDKNNKISKLSIYFNHDEIEFVAQNVVFNQEELKLMIDENKELIYLYEGEYSIPFDKGNKRYIGVGNVINSINNMDTLDLNKSNIVLENITLKSKSKVTVISKESKGLKFNNNITYKENNFDDYEVFTQIDKVYDNEEDSYWVNAGNSFDGYYPAIRLYRSIDNKKELIINEMMNVSTFCRYENQIFYIARVKSEKYKYGEHCICKVNIDGSENIKIASLEKYGYMYLARNDKNDSPYTRFIGVTDKYIVWNDKGSILSLSKEGIYICKHDGNGIEQIISDKFIVQITLIDEYLIYIYSSNCRTHFGLSGYSYIEKFNINTRESNTIEYKVRDKLVKYDKTIFYVTYEEYKDKIYELDIITNKKRKLAEIRKDHYYLFDRLEYINGYLYYYRKHRYDGDEIKEEIKI